MAGSKYKKNIYLDFFLKIVGAKILHWKELLPFWTLDLEFYS